MSYVELEKLVKIFIEKEQKIKLLYNVRNKDQILIN